VGAHVSLSLPLTGQLVACTVPDICHGAGAQGAAEAEPGARTPHVPTDSQGHLQGGLEGLMLSSGLCSRGQSSIAEGCGMTSR
jgi:hypothetical protein